MDLLSIFSAIFVAELGDKTQIAALLFSAGGRHHPMAVFVAASLALCLSTGIAVFVGTAAKGVLERVPVGLIAGICFMALGAWMVFDHLRASA
ncbi:MAG: TMEM165/GDT1 family protein [Hyphomicrobiales bacterium]|nr:TMEM165/GDT1 family protein [Hyphomicrobiales bacterium]